MRTTAMVGTAFVLAFSLAQVQAQVIPNVPAEVKGPAPAGVNVQVTPPAAIVPQTKVPDVGPAPVIGIEQKQNAIGPVVEPNRAAGAAVGIEGPSPDIRARYRWQNGQWWYQMENGSWMYHSNGQWVAFNPSTYAAPQATAPQTYAPQAGNYGSANDGGYYSGNTYVNPGYGYYQDGTGYGSGYYSQPGYGYSGYGYGTPGYGYSSGYRGYGYPGYGNGYYNRGAVIGGSIGSQIGGQIGGSRGAFFGGNIGSQIGGNRNNR